MTKIFWLWKRCNWCGKVSFLGLGWIKGDNSSFDYCSGICAEKKRTGYDLDSGDTAKRGW
jgi:hypothetical protein